MVRFAGNLLQGLIQTVLMYSRGECAAATRAVSLFSHWGSGAELDSLLMAQGSQIL